MSQKILLPVNVCTTIPQLPDDLVVRENLINEIEDIFEECRFVIVTGREGNGKTTLLNQFALHFAPENSICIFVRQVTNYLDKYISQDLCNQLEVLATGQEIDDELLKDSDDKTLQARIVSNLYLLARRVKRSNEKLYFIIDGLHHIGSDDSDILSRVLELVQVGFEIPGFYFLISSQTDAFPIQEYTTSEFRTLRVTPFSKSEVEHYLHDLDGLDPDDINELRKISRGNASYLSNAKKALLAKNPLDRSLEELSLSGQHRQLFRIRWDAFEITDTLMLPLAILAHDPRSYPLEFLSKVVGSNSQDLKNELRHLDFIIFTSDSMVEYETEAFREFATTVLSYTEADVLNILSEYFLSGNQSDEEIIFFLPYLKEVERYEQLLQFLTNDRLEKSLDQYKSSSFLMKIADIGLDAAFSVDSEEDVLRFLTHKTLVRELQVSDALRSEIEALMSLNDYDGALALAQTATLTEDRLLLLSVIAKKKLDAGLEAENTLQQHIQQLYRQLDMAALDQERAMMIAFDLIHSHPTLAIEIVEKSLEGSNTNSPNALDFALASLSLSTLLDKDKAKTDSLKSRIQDPIARRLATEFVVMFGDYSATQILAEAETLDDIGHKLHIMRSWILNNRKDSDAAEVTIEALKLAIRTTEYSASAQLFRELASPIPFISDAKQQLDLIKLFDRQQAIVLGLGPNVELVRLQLTLAEAESHIDIQLATERLSQVWNYIDSKIDDLSAKTECVARFYSRIKQLNLNSASNTFDPTIIENTFRLNYERLIGETAEHFIVARGAITGLAKQHPDLAIDCALALNTQPRRDKALVGFINTALHRPITEIDFVSISVALSSVREPDLADQAILDIIHRLESSKELPAPILDDAKIILEQLENIRDAADCCLACASCLSIFQRTNSDPYELSIDLQAIMENRWQSIDRKWEQIDVAFQIINKISDSDYALSQLYLAEVTRIKSEISLYSKNAAIAFIYLMRLIIRGYSAHISNNIYSFENDTQELDFLIAHIPSYGEQAILWSELALRFYEHNDINVGMQIVNKYVRPLIEKVSDKDAVYKAHVIVVAGPALYKTHHQTTIDLINQLPARIQDAALVVLCEYIILNRLPIEKYDDAGQVDQKITFDDAYDVCEIIQNIESDFNIYHVIGMLSDAIANSDQILTRVQTTEISSKILKIISTKLPNPDHISHDGYRILAEAMMYRLRPTSSQQIGHWNELVKSAEAIDNTADSAFVLHYLASLMPTKFREQRDKYLQRSLVLIQDIPSLYDRTHHYELFASLTRPMDPRLSKEALQKAMQMAAVSHDPEMDVMKKGIIELAYRIDPTLAESLASVIDDDPARQRARQQIRILELRKNLHIDSGEINEATPLEITSATSKRLASLNSGRSNPIHHQDSSKLLKYVSLLPFHHSYTILAYVTQNAVMRFRQDPNSTRRHIAPIVGAAKASARLVLKLAGYNLAQQDTSKAINNGSIIDSGIVVSKKEDALNYIRQWLTENAQEAIYICDPYTGPDELIEILQLVLSNGVSCRVELLTSIDSHKSKESTRVTSSWQEEYLLRWRRISDQDPPRTNVILAGYQSNGKLPVHDRYWLSNGSGFSIGTSFNGLGKRKTIISPLSEQQCQDLKSDFDLYRSSRIYEMNRNSRDERINYQSFSL